MALRASGLQPNTVTYSTLITAAERSQQTDAALQAFDDMRREGVAPNQVNYAHHNP